MDGILDEPRSLEHLHHLIYSRRTVFSRAGKGFLSFKVLMYILHCRIILLGIILTFYPASAKNYKPQEPN